MMMMMMMMMMMVMVIIMVIITVMMMVKMIMITKISITKEHSYLSFLDGSTLYDQKSGGIRQF